MFAAAVETIGVFPDLRKGLSDLLIEMLCIGRVRVLVLKDESQLLTGRSITQSALPLLELTSWRAVTLAPWR